MDELMSIQSDYVKQAFAYFTQHSRRFGELFTASCARGETREVTFTIKRAQLASLRPNMRYVVSPGTYSVALGPNSAQLMEARFEVLDLKNGRARKAGAHVPSAAASGKRTKAAASGR